MRIGRYSLAEMQTACLPSLLPANVGSTRHKTTFRSFFAFSISVITHNTRRQTSTEHSLSFLRDPVQLNVKVPTLQISYVQPRPLLQNPPHLRMPILKALHVQPRKHAGNSCCTWIVFNMKFVNLGRMWKLKVAKHCRFDLLRLTTRTNMMP